MMGIEDGANINPVLNLVLVLRGAATPVLNPVLVLVLRRSRARPRPARRSRARPQSSTHRTEKPYCMSRE
jgi:hypothetical protein